MQYDGLRCQPGFNQDHIEIEHWNQSMTRKPEHSSNPNQSIKAFIACRVLLQTKRKARRLECDRHNSSTALTLGRHGVVIEARLVWGGERTGCVAGPLAVS